LEHLQLVLNLEKLNELEKLNDEQNKTEPLQEELEKIVEIRKNSRIRSRKRSSRIRIRIRKSRRA